MPKQKQRIQYHKSKKSTLVKYNCKRAMEGINAAIDRHLVGKLNVIESEDPTKMKKSQLFSKWILIVAAY